MTEYDRINTLLNEHETLERTQARIIREIDRELSSLYPEILYFTNVEIIDCVTAVKFSYVESEKPYQEVTKMMQSPKNERDIVLYRAIKTGARISRWI